MPPRLAARRSGRQDVVQDSLISHTLAASLRQACFCFVHNSTGGLPLTVFRFRKELAYVFEASLQHLIKDGSRTSPCLCGLGVRVSALWLAHASRDSPPCLHAS